MLMIQKISSLYPQIFVTGGLGMFPVTILVNSIVHFENSLSLSYKAQSHMRGKLVSYVLSLKFGAFFPFQVLIIKAHLKQVHLST